MSKKEMQTQTREELLAEAYALIEQATDEQLDKALEIARQDPLLKDAILAFEQNKNA
jgi:hypothetical protein